jgi:hypothetical protein
MDRINLRCQYKKENQKRFYAGILVDGYPKIILFLESNRKVNNGLSKSYSKSIIFRYSFRRGIAYLKLQSVKKFSDRFFIYMSK